MQKEKASTILKLVSNEEEDDYLEIEKASTQIKEEIKSLPGIRKGYPLLDDAKIENTILPTINNILVSISPKF